MRGVHFFVDTEVWKRGEDISRRVNPVLPFLFCLSLFFFLRGSPCVFWVSFPSLPRSFCVRQEQKFLASSWWCSMKIREDSSFTESGMDFVARVARPKSLAMWHCTRSHRKPESLHCKHFSSLDVKKICVFLASQTNTAGFSWELSVRGPRMWRRILGRWICVWGTPDYCPRSLRNPSK